MTAHLPTTARPEAARTGGRVVVAMSGGVDSSVVAGLLQRDGYDVVGITMQLYDHGAATGRKGSCCAGQDIHDARLAAETLGIPHYVLDYERRFRAKVIDSFAESYVRGETPVPCITCNSDIKFADLLATARELGADHLATGHYIHLADAGGPVLRRAADAARDQSYFLFATTRAQLAQLMFPLGELTKPEVRDLARSFGLPTAEKPDSQDICFVASGHYSDVVARLRPEAASPGEIVHVDGRVLGRHAGIMNFTVGQRRGLGIAAAEPLFVVRLDAGKCEVRVGPRACLETRRVHLRDTNWLGDTPLAAWAADEREVHVRLRSSQPPRPATLHLAPNGGISVALAAPEFGISPGQACVMYADGTPRARVLGGGWIAGVEQGGPREAAANTAAVIAAEPIEPGPLTLRSGSIDMDHARLAHRHGTG